MEMIWFLAFLAQYGALVAGVALVGALVVSTVYELVQNKVHINRVSGIGSLQEATTGSAS